MSKYIEQTKRVILRHQDGLAAISLVAVTLLLINHAHIASFSQYFIGRASADTYPEVAIVLGGGIQEGKPKPILKGRLDTAAALYERGEIRKLVVSGDNRTPEYNEPEVMKNYLMQEKGISEEQILMDMAGRSTYETCERAKKVYGLSRVVLVSETTHLPRAIYLCRSFGIETYGVPSNADAAKGLRLSQRWREFLASQKAFINVYVKGEETVLGERIDVL